jgi:hypothetical protein
MKLRAGVVLNCVLAHVKIISDNRLWRTCFCFQDFTTDSDSWTPMRMTSTSMDYLARIMAR